MASVQGSDVCWMKTRYFLYHTASSVSLPFCLSELCGGHGCISFSVWVDGPCGELWARGISADFQVSRPVMLVNDFNFKRAFLGTFSGLSTVSLWLWIMKWNISNDSSFFLPCLRMESSPLPQSGPISSVLQTSGLPESMTVGECLSSSSVI